jgi:hypothetical protein
LASFGNFAVEILCFAQHTSLSPGIDLTLFDNFSSGFVSPIPIPQQEDTRPSTPRLNTVELYLITCATEDRASNQALLTACHDLGLLAFASGLEIE